MPSSPPNLEMPALHGGTPVREKLLPYGRQSLDEDDIQAVVETLRSDWLTTGPKVGEFEEAFANWVGARHAVSFSSGTAALHGAAFAAGVGQGDEVITTPLTFCATANCILYQGATPVFADVSNDTLNLDPREVEKQCRENFFTCFFPDKGDYRSRLRGASGGARRVARDSGENRSSADRRRVSRAGRGVSRQTRRQPRRHDRLQFSSGEASDDR